MPNLVFDPIRFLAACENVAGKEAATGFRENTAVGKNRKSRTRSVSREGYTNIGGLSESTLHLVLKYFIEENADYHEVGCGKYQLDVSRDGFTYEIQTGKFSAFRKKLSSVLLERTVRVVYPVIARKRLVWTDPDTGEVGGFRKSPKTETSLNLLKELIYILPIVAHENLSFSIVTLACDEYKLLCGWSKDKKKGAVRYNRVPTALLGVENYESAEDYLHRYLPSFSEGEFLTSGTFAEKMKSGKDIARIALHVLRAVGYLVEDGKDGRFVRFRAVKGFAADGV